MMIRWPGVVKPGTQINDIVSLIDWMPTFATAAGIPDLKEKMKTGFQAIEFLGRNMWLLVPIQAKIKEFFSDFDKFPYQEGSTLNPSGINYATLRQQDALRRLKDLERLNPQ